MSRLLTRLYIIINIQMAMPLGEMNLHNNCALGISDNSTLDV